MPRKHCSSRVRNRGNVVRSVDTAQVKLFDHVQETDNWRNWTCQTVLQEHVAKMEKAGDVKPVRKLVNGMYETVGYQYTAASQPVPYSGSDFTPATLTMGTMNAVAKQAGVEHAKSIRQPVCGRDRMSRRDRDQVEKFKAWPLIGDTKAVAVRPRIYEHERREAEKMLRTGYLKAA